MTLIRLTIIVSAILSLTCASNQLKQHPESASVPEGMFANFTCAIRLPGTLKWRIGSFEDEEHVYNTGDQLNRIQGLDADVLSSERDGKIYTETIQILANKTLNGTPIECMFEPQSKQARKRYSKFALLTVKEVTTEEEELPVTRRSLSDRESSLDETTASSGAQSVSAAALTLVLTSLAHMIDGN